MITRTGKVSNAASHFSNRDPLGGPSDSESSDSPDSVYDEILPSPTNKSKSPRKTLRAYRMEAKKTEQRDTDSENVTEVQPASNSGTSRSFHITSKQQLISLLTANASQQKQSSTARPLPTINEDQRTRSLEQADLVCDPISSTSSSAIEMQSQGNTRYSNLSSNNQSWARIAPNQQQMVSLRANSHYFAQKQFNSSVPSFAIPSSNFVGVPIHYSQQSPQRFAHANVVKHFNQSFAGRDPQSTPQMTLVPSSSTSESVNSQQVAGQMLCQIDKAVKSFVSTLPAETMWNKLFKQLTPYEQDRYLSSKLPSHELSDSVPPPPKRSQAPQEPPPTRTLPVVHAYVNPFNYTTYRTFHGISADDPSQETSSVRAKKHACVWTCILCSKVFESKIAVIDHYVDHKQEEDALRTDKCEEKAVECPLCFRSFVSMAGYDKHVESFHNKKQELCCDTCKRVFLNAYTMSIHVCETLKSDRFTCCVCHKFTTKSSKTLRTHINKEHEPERYDCADCGKVFTSLSWFNDHKIFHITTPHRCKLCEKSFPSKRLLVGHYLQAHQKKYVDVRYECKECDMTFPMAQSLKKHTRYMHEKESHLCTKCGRTFDQKRKLKYHMDLHSGVKKFTCTVCGTPYFSSSNLAVHMRTHTGEKPYKCDTCGKSFSQINSLKTHMRYHTGERPYTCDKCGKGHVSKSGKDIHQKKCKKFKDVQVSSE